MKTPPVIVLLLTLIVGLSARGVAAEEAFSAIKLKYEVAMERIGQPLDSLRSNYLARLDALEKEITAQGDLTGVLAVKEERLSLGKGTPGPLASNASLKRLQEIFRKESLSLNAAASTERLRITKAYVKRLEEIEQAVTREKKIDEALKIRTEREAMEATLLTLNQTEGPPAPLPGDTTEELRWKAMQDGKFSEEEGEYILKGPGAGRDTSVASVALLMRELAPAVRIKGKCYVVGNWGGFILGADKRLNDYTMVYTGHSGQSFNYEMVANGVRSGAKAGATVAWERNKWIDFTIDRDGEVWSFEINGAKKEFPAAKGDQRDYFGMMLFQDAEMRVKDLRIRERK
jgi:hypothetical protein